MGETRAEDEMGGLCQKNDGVSFPRFAKDEVNRSSAHPLFDWSRSQTGGRIGNKIRRYLTELLVPRDGTVL